MVDPRDPIPEQADVESERRRPNPLGAVLGRVRNRRLGPVGLAVAVTVGLFLIGGLVEPGFASLPQAHNLLKLASFLAILAAGQTLTIISGGDGIDLSIPSVATVTAIIVAWISDGSDAKLAVAIAPVVGVCVLVGTINGLGIVFFGIPPLVMTLGMGVALDGLVYVLTQGTPRGSAPPALNYIANDTLIFGFQGIVFVAIAMGVVMWLLLRRSTYGMRLYAVGANRAAALGSGVRVPRTVVFTYVLSSLFAGVGGIFLLGYADTVYLNLGAPYLLPSVAAVVVGGTTLAGGTGGYGGTLAGALLLTVLISFLTAVNVSAGSRDVIYGLILLAMLSIYGRQRALRQ